MVAQRQRQHSHPTTRRSTIVTWPAPIGMSRFRLFLLVIISANLHNDVCSALQLNTFSSSNRRSNNNNNRNSIKDTIRQSAANFVPLPPPQAVTSTLISQLAVIAIKNRLKEYRDVDCDVSFPSPNLLLRGRVGPVTVSGKKWQSGLGLSCRAITATVSECALDASRILSHRKLLLTTPALGTAMVALNSADFANFITHPLLRPPSTDASISFIKEGSLVDPATDTVTFYSRYADARWKCGLQRAQEGRRAFVNVSFDDAPSTSTSEAADALDQDVVAQRLAEMLTNFFNDMVFELDGTFLSFRDMMITDKGEAPSVMLALNIRVKKFPSPGLDF